MGLTPAGTYTVQNGIIVGAHIVQDWTAGHRGSRARAQRLGTRPVTVPMRDRIAVRRALRPTTPAVAVHIPVIWTVREALTHDGSEKLANLLSIRPSTFGPYEIRTQEDIKHSAELVHANAW